MFSISELALGFQQWQRVDQHALIGNAKGRLLQFAKGGAGGNALFQHGMGFQPAPVAAAGEGHYRACLPASWPRYCSFIVFRQ